MEHSAGVGGSFPTRAAEEQISPLFHANEPHINFSLQRSTKMLPAITCLQGLLPPPSRNIQPCKKINWDILLLSSTQTFPYPLCVIIPRAETHLSTLRRRRSVTTTCNETLGNAYNAIPTTVQLVYCPRRSHRVAEGHTLKKRTSRSNKTTDPRSDSRHDPETWG